MGNYQMSVLAMLLGMTSYAFYRYHKFPSSVFLGDSGTLFLGATFATVAIAGNVEVFAFIILAPMVLNSFLFLASVRKIIEHREIKKAAVVHDENFNLMDSKLKGAPVTLVRLIVQKVPLSEQKVADRIITLVTISSAIAIGLAYLT
jgi:UDP-N-acetylglucosamine--dolichyl-phosphate N-acetylglucosaminephosphotransferase